MALALPPGAGQTSSDNRLVPPAVVPPAPLLSLKATGVAAAAPARAHEGAPPAPLLFYVDQNPRVYTFTFTW